MAVPTGKYLVRASIDLSPLFGVIEQEIPIEIIQPGRNALEQNLAALGDEDPNARREALRQLQFFPGHGEKIAARVVDLVRDPDPDVRSMAIQVLIRYLDSLKPHAGKLLPLLTDENLSDHPRMAVAFMVASHAPPGRAVEAALSKALEIVDAKNRMGIRSALDLYHQRAGD